MLWELEDDGYAFSDHTILVPMIGPGMFLDLLCSSIVGLF